MSYVVTVIGLEQRAAIKFLTQWEAQDYATDVKVHHPELNVFVAPIFPDPHTIDWSQFNGGKK